MNANEAVLGDEDEMYYRFFDQWYDDDGRKLKLFQATRPDMETVNEWVNASIEKICPINKEWASEVLRRIDVMLEASQDDWESYLPVKRPITMEWVRQFDSYYDLSKIEDILQRSDPSDFSNDYVVLVCEFGAVMGHMLLQLLPRLTWLPSWPYWESSIFDPKTGSVIPVFHWAIKKFSTYGIDDGFGEKVEVCVQMLKDEAV